ncbi:class I SAM-dependent DNA methyltransferase [Alkalicoccus chagannorensis]|uniref:class I SAM-dependent DNA methyltransferase n=1 Tax=Alkalicoccus chagannorensis TaxID=427072 RepID=UPI000402D1DD|nr:class I SAM-dependent methyltransferase [Alkalicoccus chagannorensis]
MSSTHFASLYDLLMEDAPYEEWLDYTRRFAEPGSRILDLACGTGTLTLQLAAEGYTMTGIDISADMLAAAEGKARAASESVSFVQQDMRELHAGTYDVVTLYCDGLNYLAEESDVKQTFQHVAASLEAGGVFLFDVHTPFKMEHIFHHQLYGEDGAEVSYLWFCEPGDDPLSVHHLLTFFVKGGDGRYERMDEELYQRTFSPSSYERWLKESGFTDIEVKSEFGAAEANPNDERLFFKAVKNSW